MEILYEDEELIAVVKPAGILSEDSGKDDSVPGILKSEGRKEIYCVHRLDRAVGGVMVYAKTAGMSGKLSKIISERAFQKEYLAVVHGVPDEEKGELCDLLFKDAKKNRSYVVNRMRKGVKEAKLEYQTLETVKRGEECYSLVHVKLHTGRSHQIRVQFSSRKMPLLGDHKYGSRTEEKFGIALWSQRIVFSLGKKEYVFSKEPSGEGWEWFKNAP